jgi:energy-coupling factor transport system permease protein
MSEFEVLRFLAIGQYLPSGSILHRLDPRVKLASISLLMFVFMLRAGPTVVFLGLLIALALLGIARFPWRHALRSLRPLLPLFLVALLLQLLLYPHRAAVAAGSLPLLAWGPVVISGAGLVSLAVILMGMVDVVLLLTLQTAIADTTDVAHGIEGLLSPFQRLGLPAHEVTMVFTIALRFVPLLGEEMERLMKAQAARGADFGRRRGGLLQRVRSRLPLMVPLFMAALRRAEELAVALEARGYVGGSGRSHLVRLRMRPIDYVALLLAGGICAALLFANPAPLEQAVALWVRGLLEKA